jgi:hypothetical protein
MDHEDDHHEKKHAMDHEDDHHERKHVIDRPDTKFHQVKNEANRGIVEMLNEMAGKHFLLGHQQNGSKNLFKSLYLDFCKLLLNVLSCM